MSANAPDYKKTLLYQGAVDAANYRRRITRLMLLFIGLALLLTVGHALVPSLVGAAPAGLWRTASLFAVFWLVFNAAWALIDHMTVSRVRANIEGVSIALVSAANALNAASSPPTKVQTEAPSDAPSEQSVTYMTDFLKERLAGLKPAPKADA